MLAADMAVVAPPSMSDEYPGFILDLCERFEVRMLTSLHDIDAFALRLIRGELDRRSIAAFLPGVEWSSFCLDKFQCGDVLAGAGFRVPSSILTTDDLQHFLDNGARFPLVVKSRCGFGSAGYSFCRSREELVEAFHPGRFFGENKALHEALGVASSFDSIIQEYVDGREVCFNIVNGLDGSFAAHFGCEIVSMRGGESEVAVTLDQEFGLSHSAAFAELTKHRGTWGLDCIERDGLLYVLDVNPRFTGDYPFNQLAGANVPAVMLAWASGSPPDPNWLRRPGGVWGYKDIVPKRSMAHLNK